MSSSRTKSDGRASSGLPLQKQKMHSFAHCRGTICSNIRPRSSPSSRSNLDIERLAVRFLDVKGQFRLARGLKSKIEIIPHRAGR